MFYSLSFKNLHLSLLANHEVIKLNLTCTEKLECRNVATEDKNPLEIGISSCERNKLVFCFGINDLNSSNSIRRERH